MWSAGGRANLPQHRVVGVDQLAFGRVPQLAGVADHSAAAAAGGEGPQLYGRWGDDLKQVVQDQLQGLAGPHRLEALWGGAGAAVGE